MTARAAGLRPLGRTGLRVSPVCLGFVLATKVDADPVTGDFSHNRFTLLDRSAEPLMDDAARAGVAFLNGAPYGGGILVKGPDAQPRYAYRLASERVQARSAPCRGHALAAPSEFWLN
jgi:D-threo-aldose 1-dehydrogenase